MDIKDLTIRKIEEWEAENDKDFYDLEEEEQDKVFKEVEQKVIDDLADLIDKALELEEAFKLKLSKYGG